VEARPIKVYLELRSVDSPAFSGPGNIVLHGQLDVVGCRHGPMKRDVFNHDRLTGMTSQVSGQPAGSRLVERALILYRVVMLA
jgi:hypothetical protein